MNIDVLEKVGLTEGEAKVYMALLELGTTTTGLIIKKSGISASKVYEILNKLVEKGLVSYITKEKTKHFKSADPNRILDYLDEKEKDILDKKEEIKKILPELMLKQKEKEKEQEATIYEGVKGVKTAHEKMLREMKRGEGYCFMGASVLSTEKFGSYWKNWHRRRAEKGIKGKLLFNRDVDKSELEDREKSGFCKAKYMPFDISTPAWIKVYKNITEIGVPTENPLSVEIKSSEVAESFRAYFEALWEQKIYTYQGVKQIKQLISKSLDFGDYDVFAEGMKIVDTLGEDFFVWWQNEKKKREITSRGIMGEKYRNLPTVTKSITKFKFIPGFENPGLTFIFKDKVINMMLSKEPVAFLIDNKEVADSNRVYFELLWKQDVIVRKGVEEIENTFNMMLDELNPGEEYYVLGASWMGFKERAFDYFIDFHKRRHEKGVKAKFLFIAGTEKTIEKYKESYSKLTEVKYLPPNVYEGMQINIYKNKVLFFVWREDEPIVFSIEDETTHDTFKTYFDSLWDQNVRTYRGYEAFKKVWLEMLQQGDVLYFIGARGYYFDKRPKDAEEIVEVARKKGMKWKNVVDIETKGHRITQIEFAETRYFKEKITFPGVLWVCGKRTIITNWAKEEPIATVIDDPDIADTYRNYFEILWGMAKP